MSSDGWVLADQKTVGVDLGGNGGVTPLPDNPPPPTGVGGNSGGLLILGLLIAGGLALAGALKGD